MKFRGPCFLLLLANLNFMKIFWLYFICCHITSLLRKILGPNSVGNFYSWFDILKKKIWGKVNISNIGWISKSGNCQISNKEYYKKLNPSVNLISNSISSFRSMKIRQRKGVRTGLGWWLVSHYDCKRTDNVFGIEPDGCKFLSRCMPEKFNKECV